MPPNTPAEAPQSGSFRRTIRKGLRLMRTNRAPSSSPPNSPRLASLLAPPSIPQSPSPSLPNTSNHLTIAQLVSHLSLGEAGHTPGPSTLGASSTSATNPESNAHPEHQKTGQSAWVSLEKALQALETSTGIFPPLKSAIREVKGCLHIIQAAAKNQDNYEELASELRGMIDTVHQYANELSSEDPNGSISNILQSINEEIERIKEKQNHGKAKRVLESAEDKNDILESYGRIELLFRQLTNNAGLWTLRKMNKQLELTLLQGLSPEEDARYNSHYSTIIKRRGCTAETREKIQSDLQHWIRDPHGAKVYWMNGMAGTGKTTIAYSLCEWLEENKLLGASFFCSRSKDSCRDISRIIPTIACQLARYSPAFRSGLCKALEGDQGISKLNVVQQFERLLKVPLLEAKEAIPPGVVIVIDALDECEDSHGIRLVLSTLMRFVGALPVKFFVASRPEPAIYEKIQKSGDSLPAILRLHDIEESIVVDDIKKYLKEALGVMFPPPSDDQIGQLATHAGKLFIYAATVARYILPDNVSVDSDARLRSILSMGSQPTSNPRSAQRYKELDALYSMILAAAFNEHLEEDEIEAIRLVLWTVVCANEPLNSRTIASLLALTEQRVLSALRPLRSVLHVSEDNGAVSTLHGSFPDYLFDRLRSSDFYCHRISHHLLLAGRCFEVMKAQLRFNICNLESSLTFDAEVRDLDKRIQTSISDVLFYACRYWGEHLGIAGASDELGAQLFDFLSWRLLFWMEVLNLKQCIGVGVVTLSQARSWLVTKNASDDELKLGGDALEFLAWFSASTSTRSTPHIYISALPFCPKTSLVYVLYWGRTRGLLDVKGSAISQRTQAAISTWSTVSKVMTVAFSPDSTFVASGCHDGTIRVHETRTGEIVTGPFQGHTDPVNSIAFSPDGTRIVSGSGCQSFGGLQLTRPHNQTIRMWDVGTSNAVTKPFQGHTDSVTSVAFSPDGACVVSGSRDRTVRVWDAGTGETITGPCIGHQSSVMSVAFSPDGTRIVSCSGHDFKTYGDCTIRVWDTRTGNTVAGPFEGHTDSVESVAFSPLGAHIVSSSSDCTIRVWDALTGDTIAGPFRGNEGSVCSVAFSPDGTRIVSGSGHHIVTTTWGHDQGFSRSFRVSNAYTIRVWDVCTGNTVSGPFREHTGPVNSVAFSPDGTRIVSGSSDGTIRVWDAQSAPAAIGRIKSDARPAGPVTFSPDGMLIASGFSNNTIQLWNVETGDIIGDQFQGHTGRINSIAFSPDGTHIVSGSDDRTIRAWDVPTGNTPWFKLLHENMGGVQSVKFSPDGAYVLSSSVHYAIQLWDARTGQAIAGPFSGHEAIYGVVSGSLLPNNVCVLTGSSDGLIRLWEVQTGDTVKESLVWCIRQVRSLSVAPNGSLVVSAPRFRNVDIEVRETQADTGNTVVESPKGHYENVNSVALSPDGTFMVSGSIHGTIQVTDDRTCETVTGPFNVSQAAITSVGFSRDGTRILSHSGHTTRVWYIRTDSADHDVNARPNVVRSDLMSSSWKFNDDGWITVDGMPFVWLPTGLHDCFPCPPHPLAIGPLGSIRIENWHELLFGQSWSLCYSSKEA